MRILEKSNQAGIDEFSAKEILRAYGIPSTREALAGTLEEALARVRKVVVDPRAAGELRLLEETP